jgi:hypothetical protein
MAMTAERAIGFEVFVLPLLSRAASGQEIQDFAQALPDMLNL